MVVWYRSQVEFSQCKGKAGDCDTTVRLNSVPVRARQETVVTQSG